MKEHTKISAWWLPFGVALSLISYRYNLRWDGYTSNNIYIAGLSAVLIVIFSNRWLINCEKQNDIELRNKKYIVYSISLFSMIAVVFFLGWICGDLLIQFTLRGLR